MLNDIDAEVRREGDEYFLQDLGSANGTLYNGTTVEGNVSLAPGGRIQIGETEIVFDDGSYNSSMGATMITDNTTSLPEATIALASGDRTTSGLLEAIEGARTKPEERTVARAAAINCCWPMVRFSIVTPTVELVSPTKKTR